MQKWLPDLKARLPNQAGLAKPLHKKSTCPYTSRVCQGRYTPRIHRYSRPKEHDTSASDSKLLGRRCRPDERPPSTERGVQREIPSPSHTSAPARDAPAFYGRLRRLVSGNSPRMRAPRRSRRSRLLRPVAMEDEALCRAYTSGDPGPTASPHRPGRFA